jgi:hypothetical protein
MKRIALAAALAALAAPALAQFSEEQTRAYGVILPMLQELTPDAPVLSACVVTVAAPQEVAALAAAGRPTMEAGQVVSAVLARPETVGCIQATKAQR